jgi:hypothetical protein
MNSKARRRPFLRPLIIYCQVVAIAANPSSGRLASTPPRCWRPSADPRELPPPRRAAWPPEPCLPRRAVPPGCLGRGDTRTIPNGCRRSQRPDREQRDPTHRQSRRDRRPRNAPRSQPQEHQGRGTALHRQQHHHECICLSHDTLSYHSSPAFDIWKLRPPPERAPGPVRPQSSLSLVAQRLPTAAAKERREERTSGWRVSRLSWRPSAAGSKGRHGIGRHTGRGSGVHSREFRLKPPDYVFE